MSTLKKAMMGQSSRCYKPSFVEIGPPVPEKILKGFYHILAWWPSWPCDLDAANTFLSPIRKIEDKLMGSYLKSTHIAYKRDPYESSHAKALILYHLVVYDR